MCYFMILYILNYVLFHDLVHTKLCAISWYCTCYVMCYFVTMYMLCYVLFHDLVHAMLCAISWPCTCYVICYYVTVELQCRVNSCDMCEGCVEDYFVSPPPCMNNVVRSQLSENKQLSNHYYIVNWFCWFWNCS